jgi:molecular chaperone GrpE
MKIPITIMDRETPLRREGRYSLLDSHQNSGEYGYRSGRSRRGYLGQTMRSEGNAAVDRDTDREDGRERNASAHKEDVSRQESTRKRNLVGTDESREDWKERYTRLLADFENYKRHAEAQREELAGIGKEKVLEDIFPVVEHMERAIKATKDAGDQSGILEGLKMVYQEMLRVLEKNGIERIDTVGEPFDPEVHEAVAVMSHADCPEDTVVEEVRAGFRKNGKLLRPASVVVAK